MNEKQRTELRRIIVELETAEREIDEFDNCVDTYRMGQAIEALQAMVDAELDRELTR